MLKIFSKKNSQSSKNQKVWNKAGKIFLKYEFNTFKKEYEEKRGSFINEKIISRLKKYSFDKKKIAHLACNNGRELLDISFHGGKHCHGFDFSESFILQAKKLNEYVSDSCEFSTSNVYDIDDSFHNFFDIIVITPGTLVWMQDLDALFLKISKMLKKKGVIIIDELHPFLFMLERSTDEEKLQIKNSYFNQKPVPDDKALYYLGPNYVNIGKQYFYQHTMSDIVAAMINNNFDLTELSEFPEDVSVSFERYQNAIQVPMSLMIVAKKS